MEPHPVLTPKLLVSIALVAGEINAFRYNPTSCRTSALSGHSYIQELLAPETNPRRVYEALRMSRVVFLQLCSWLEAGNFIENSKNTTVQEQVAMFVWTIGRNASSRDVQERFQHSPDTVNR